MNTNTMNQTAKDISQMAEITEQRLYELGKLKVAAQGALKNLRGAA